MTSQSPHHKLIGAESKRTESKFMNEHTHTNTRTQAHSHKPTHPGALCCFHARMRYQQQSCPAFSHAGAQEIRTAGCAHSRMVCVCFVANPRRRAPTTQPHHPAKPPPLTSCTSCAHVLCASLCMCDVPNHEHEQ